MLPVVKGPVFTARAITRYAWATAFLSIFGIWALPEGGLLYGVLLTPFNFRLIQIVQRLSIEPEDLSRAKALFRWSILYMFGICLLLVISRLPIAVQLDAQGLNLLGHLATGLPLV